MKKNRNEDNPVRWVCLKKIFLVMKLTCFFTLFLLLQVSATSYSQKKVNLDVAGVSMLDVIRELRQQTGYKFFFNHNELEKVTGVTAKFVDEELEKVLDAVLGQARFTYRMEQGVIIITPVVANDEKKSVRIKGFVCDVKKKPMPGVTVKIVGLPVGTATNEKGWFAIDLPLLKGALEFSFIGYKKQKVEFTEKTDTLHIFMEEDLQGLDEVQVIAYGERKKRDVISSISSVKADDLKEIPTASFASLLQGRMAGVEVTQLSGSPGGGGIQIHVRGYNSLISGSQTGDGQPLYVIDGIPMHSFTSPVTGTNALAELDPNTIESIEVLKDAASAALYGSRAGSGVVLITTKKGKVGKAQFSANVSYSASIMPEFPEQILGKGERDWHFRYIQSQVKSESSLSSIIPEYPTSYEEAYKRGQALSGAVYDGWWGDGSKSAAKDAAILQDSLNPHYNNQTNWWKRFFRTGKIFNANIQAVGGVERIRYMTGLAYYKESGINQGSDFKRVNFVANLSLKPANRILFDTRVNLSYTDRSRNLNKSNWSQKAKAVESMNADPGATSSLLPVGGAMEDEILKQLNSTILVNDSYRLMWNATLGVDIFKGLSFKPSVGVDLSQNNNNTFSPTFLDKTNNFNRSSGQITRELNITQENLLNYSRTFKEAHNLELLVGSSYNEMRSYNIQGTARDLASDNIHYATSKSKQYVKLGDNFIYLKDYYSNYTQQIMMSYLARLAYNYKSRYLLEATWRRDGSSVFGEKNRWATFPAVAVGWTFSEESFMKRFAWLSNGKLRASWGTSGKTVTDPYLSHSEIKESGEWLGNVGMSAAMINSYLKWEESDQYDIGLDLDLLEYRLKFKLDYYYKLTKDMLYEVSFPNNVFGGTSQIQNAMEVSNEGLELELQADIFRETAVSWRMRFNISRNWNLFRKSNNGQDVSSMVIGRPLQGLYLYKDNGYWQSQDEVVKVQDSDGNIGYLKDGNAYEYYYYPGTRRYVDLDGDGTISDSDTYFAYTSFPKAYGGWSHELMWKNFTLNLHFSFVFNRKMINSYAYSSLYKGSDKPIFTDYRKLSFWQQAGDDTSMPVIGSPYEMDKANIASRVESVSSLRLNMLNLGYDLPKKYAKKVGLNGARIFFTGENLFLLTNYSGLDPEVVPYSDPVDVLDAYPLARKFTIGLTLNF